MTRLGTLVVCLGFANAQADSLLTDRTATRPNAGGAPEQITVRLGLLDISEIDDREQVFEADIFVEVRWQDPRLAIVGEGTASLRTFGVGDIWTPRLLAVNDRGLNRQLPDVVTVDSEGNVVLRQRLAGPLAVDLNLRRFPFDTQRLPIDIVSYQYGPSEIVFSGASEMLAKLDQLSGLGWSYTALTPERSVYRLKEDNDGVAQLSFAVSAERMSAYYVLTLALPMTLILFLAWMVHWLPVDVVPARMGTASAAVFSLIAFGVSFRLTLPKIPYLTEADRFVLYSTLLVLVSLAITVLCVRWSSGDRKDDAIRLTRQTRVGFPIAYGLIVLSILMS